MKYVFCCHYNFYNVGSLYDVLLTGDDVTKAVNSETTFAPVTGPVAPSTTSIIWKHRDNNGVVVKVIEWDRVDDSTDIPNANFKSHATLDKSTGTLNLKYLQLKHSGVYTVDINSKEQRKQFTLTVIGQLMYCSTFHIHHLITVFTYLCQK